MRPQSYCGGCTPSPRKLSPASASSASPAAIVVVIRSGSAMFGRMCRRSSRTPPDAEHAAPRRRTRSRRPRTTSVWLSRAKYGATATPIPTTAPARADADRPPRRRSRRAGPGTRRTRLMNPLTSRPIAAADERGQRAERDADQRAEPGGQDGERDRQPRRDEHAVEDVAAERVGAERVRAARALRRAPGCRAATPRPTRAAARRSRGRRSRPGRATPRFRPASAEPGPSGSWRARSRLEDRRARVDRRRARCRPRSWRAGRPCRRRARRACTVG